MPKLHERKIPERSSSPNIAPKLVEKRTLATLRIVMTASTPSPIWGIDTKGERTQLLTIIVKARAERTASISNQLRTNTESHTSFLVAGTIFDHPTGVESDVPKDGEENVCLGSVGQPGDRGYTVVVGHDVVGVIAGSLSVLYNGMLGNVQYYNCDIEL